MIPVKVKWNNQTFDVEIDSTKSVSDFKEQLKKHTNVPVERQKLMAKGGWAGILKDDAKWENCKLAAGLTVLLMGSAETAPEPMEVAASQSIKAKEEEVGEENLKSGDGADEHHLLNYPTGMINTGNTCYLNSVLESVRFLPEFQDTLNTPGLGSNSKLLNILNQVFQIMKSSKQAMAPFPFITELRTRFPQFSEMRNGHYAQQDADELYSCIATELTNTISHSNAAIPSSANPFVFDVDSILNCAESNEEEPVHMIETMNKLTCNISGGTDKLKVDNIYEGLKLSFECTIDKFSQKLNRDAQWNKKQKLINLPNCLCVHFVRFYWKAFQERNANGQTGVKCKIMRQVNFPETLDMYEFCSEQLQSQLQLVRSGKPAENGMTKDGKYKLFSVVAHKGRDADAGHYIAYVRDTLVETRWWKFDDNTVSPSNLEEVLSLKGGGDKEMVYLCIYRAA